MRSNRLLLVIVFAALALLSAATALLASLHHDIRAERVAHHIATGDAYAAGGELEAAVREYRAALLLERDNPEAGRALARTLLALGRFAEGENYLRDLLRGAPTEGALHRGLARVHAARGRDAEAREAYQRAIYGEWPGGSLKERTDTRFELIEYLAGRGAEQEVLAELLRLRAELPSGQTALARRVADLLTKHGAPDLAVQTLRTAAQTSQRDVELLAHLAALEMGAGRPADARATLRRAVALGPDRADLAEQLQVVERVLALDPTLPRLTLVTRTRRARLILTAVMNHTRPCATEERTDLQALRKEAAAHLRQRLRADAERAEQELALAGRLWAAAPECHTSTPEGRALAQVLQQVGAASDTQP